MKGSETMKFTLKGLRANKDLTQKQAGEMVGVSKDVWRNWETGRSYPNAEHIKKILEYFSVSYDDIIFLKNITL